MRANGRGAPPAALAHRHDHVRRDAGTGLQTAGPGAPSFGPGWPVWTTGCQGRRYGLTIDNLLEADVVLADGRLVTASASQHEDLFWALRGGGGNFGVVTSFLFRAHPVHTVHAGLTLWGMDRAAEILRW